MSIAVYTGIFLMENAKIDAMVTMYKYAGPSLDNIYAHHLTLKFRPPDDEVADLNVGDFADIKVVGWVANDKAQALVCSVNEPCSNIIPHITISTAAGVPPVYSNELVSNGFNNIDQPFNLVGVIGYFDGSRVIT